MTGTESELLTREQLLKKLGISDRSERRGRNSHHAWPPHLRIGKKVYYRRALSMTGCATRKRSATPHRRKLRRRSLWPVRRR